MNRSVFADLAAAIASHEQALSGIAAALAELDCEAGPGRAGRRAGLRTAGARRQLRFRDPRRPPSRGGAGAQSRQFRRLHRERLRTGGRAARNSDRLRRGDRGPHLARHRAEHGGQVDIPAPERAHHRAGADGFLRASALRPHRRRRPAVLPRRRLRRSRARPLDLHGGDGGDRRHSEPGERSLAW